MRAHVKLLHANWYALISGLALAGLAACAQPSLSETQKYRVSEMRSDIVRPVRPTGDHNLAWLDDHRVLFEGWDRVLKDTLPSKGPSVGAWHGLYIWNVRTGEVSRYATEPLRAEMCFADGYINYVIGRGIQQIRMEGPMGLEKPLPSIGNEARDRPVNRFTCRSYQRSDLPKPIVGGGIEPLRPEDGWLEHTGTTTWFRSSVGELKLLVSDGQPIGTVRPQKYSSAATKYVFWHPSQDRTWLINGRGDAELQPGPIGKLLKGRLEPAASGALLLISSQINVRSNWDVGAAGLYIFGASEQQPPKRLIAGLIDAMRVHASGCLIAAIVDPWNGPAREHQLKVADNCAEGRHVGQ